MKNVTITVPDSVAKWARVWAARHDTSVSRLVGELLMVRMEEETGYEAAMKRYLGHKPEKLRERSTAYPRREELHDR